MHNEDAMVKHLRVIPPETKIQIKFEGMILAIKADEIIWNPVEGIVYLPTDVENQIISKG